jgi:anti-sigma B factor antagonist
MDAVAEPEQLRVVVDEPRPGALVVHLNGWLDLATAPILEARLRDLLDTGTPRTVVLDLRRTEFLGSAGIAVLLRLRRRALSRGLGVPHLVGLAGSAHRTLRGLGILDLFSVVDTVDAALSAADTQSRPR